MDAQTRQEIREKLDDLERRENEIREQRRPYDDAIEAIDEEREDLLAKHETELIHNRCETCSAVIFEGDLAWTDGSGEVSMCWAHAPTWGDELADARETDADAWDEPDGREKFIAIAETKPADEKHVWKH